MYYDEHQTKNYTSHTLEECKRIIRRRRKKMEDKKTEEKTVEIDGHVLELDEETEGFEKQMNQTDQIVKMIEKMNVLQKEDIIMNEIFRKCKIIDFLIVIKEKEYNDNIIPKRWDAKDKDLEKRGKLLENIDKLKKQRFELIERLTLITLI